MHEQLNYNKIPKYITNSNLILLIQKLQEEVEGLNLNVPIFLETLKRAHQMYVWK